MNLIARILAMMATSASPRDSRRGMFQVAGAVALFGLWHSLLCWQGTKRAARRLCGERAGRAFYRLFFNLQSLVTVGALVVFVLSRPQRIVYETKGLARVPFWLGRGSALALMAWSIRELRFRRFSGLQGASDFLGQRGEIAEPETQSPDGDDGPYERGPFRWSRHAADWAPLLLLWLTPTLKTNWLAFNAISTLYTLVGVWHEEKRLAAKGGAAYARYQKRVNLFFGRSKAKS